MYTNPLGGKTIDWPEAQGHTEVTPHRISGDCTALNADLCSPEPHNSEP